jgi:hypothetical protein
MVTVTGIMEDNIYTSDRCDKHGTCVFSRMLTSDRKGLQLCSYKHRNDTHVLCLFLTGIEITTLGKLLNPDCNQSHSITIASK